MSKCAGFLLGCEEQYGKQKPWLAKCSPGESGGAQMKGKASTAASDPGQKGRE